MSTVQHGVDWSRAPDILDLWEPVIQPEDVLQLTVEQAFSAVLPERWTDPLDRASARGDVVAHAVMGAPFSTPRHRLTEDWLARTQAVLQRWPARWLVDHVGCNRANGIQGAPLPLPASPALVQLAVDHLAWVQDRLQIPVGLENLALAASREDVLLQPELVERILDPVDGVLLMDLHNLWCQAVNYEFDPIDLLERWPLNRVRQIHIAGGSWKDGLRRDTHDGPVPDEVFALLPEAVRRCVNLEVIVLERIGGSAEFSARDDLLRLRNIDLRSPASFSRVPCDLPLRTEAPDLQHALFAALQCDDTADLAARAPGWWTDSRSWRVARELLETWGRTLPA